MSSPPIVTSSQVIDLNWTSYFGDATKASFTLSLPDISGQDDRKIQITRTDATLLNNITINSLVAGQTINGNASLTISGQRSYVLTCKTGKWYITASHLA